MNPKLLIFMLLLPGCATAQTKPADPAKSELGTASNVDQVLGALDARGKDFKTFSADVKLAETDNSFGETATRSGKVWFQDQGNNDARIRVKFDNIQKGENKQQPEKLDYVLAGGKLVERIYRTKSQDTRQVLRPGEKINLLKLGEGPFPLPIGQPKEEVHKEFDVKKIDAGKDDPPSTVHVQLIPHPQTRFAKQFKTIDVWVDNQSHMPTRIATRDKNETTDRTTDLSNVQVNPPMKDSDFEMEKIDLSNWNQTEEAYQE